MKTTIKVSLNERTADILVKLREFEQNKTGQVHAMNHLANVAIAAYYHQLILNNGDTHAHQEPDSSTN